MAIRMALEGFSWNDYLMKPITRDGTAQEKNGDCIVKLADWSFEQLWSSGASKIGILKRTRPD